MQGGLEFVGCGEGGILGVGNGEVDGSLEELGEGGYSPVVAHLLGLGDRAFEVGGEGTY